MAGQFKKLLAEGLPNVSQSEEGMFIILVIVAGFISGLYRARRDDNYERWSDLFAVGVCSGALGFGIVTFWLGPGHVVGRIDWFYVGFSALIGLIGKELESSVRKLFVKALTQAFTKLGIPVESNDEDDPENHD